MHEEHFADCLSFIAKHTLIAKKEPLVLAVSGGPDSVFLCHLAKEIAKVYGNKCTIAHFNHKLRPEAGEEEQFVVTLAKSLGLHCIHESCDVKAAHRGDSLEQTARQLRYAFLTRVCKEVKAKKVLLGHHKDDLAETVLLRIVRGTGLMGLRAIMPKTKMGRITLIRPMLGIEKKDILTWLDGNKIEYRIDQTNFDDVYLRNRIRSTVMPALETCNPAVKQALAQLAEHAARDLDFVVRETEKIFERRLVSQHTRRVTISLEGFFDEHPAVQYGLLRMAIERSKGDLRQMETRHYDELFDLIAHRPNHSVVDLPELKVTKLNGTLCCEAVWGKSL